jgi:hypothetical protein
MYASNLETTEDFMYPIDSKQAPEIPKLPEGTGDALWDRSSSSRIVDKSRWSSDGSELQTANKMQKKYGRYVCYPETLKIPNRANY